MKRKRKPPKTIVIKFKFTGPTWKWLREFLNEREIRDLLEKEGICGVGLLMRAIEKTMKRVGNS